MKSHAVKAPVITPVSIECDFWQEDDGGKGFCEHLMITVGGNNFEEAKNGMETALQAHITCVLRLPAGKAEP
jgi:hypothetical protein